MILLVLVVVCIHTLLPEWISEHFNAIHFHLCIKDSTSTFAMCCSSVNMYFCVTMLGLLFCIFFGHLHSPLHLFIVYHNVTDLTKQSIMGWTLTKLRHTVYEKQNMRDKIHHLVFLLFLYIILADDLNMPTQGYPAAEFSVFAPVCLFYYCWMLYVCVTGYYTRSISHLVKQTEKTIITLSQVFEIIRYLLPPIASCYDLHNQPISQLFEYYPKWQKKLNEWSTFPFFTLTNNQLRDTFQSNRQRLVDTSSNFQLFQTLHKKVPEECLDHVNCQYYDENEFNATMHNKHPSFSVLHVNLQSSFRNYGTLKACLDMLNNEFDIIGISEAGLNNLNRCAYVMGDSYFFDYKPPTKNKGGVGVYIHKRLTASRRTDLECNTNPNIENIWYELETNHTKYLVGVIYRHPGYQTQKVCDFLDECLNVAKNEKKSCIICGDINVDLLKPDSTQTKIYIDTILNDDTLPYITLPTRITSHSATLIDHILIHKPLKHMDKKIVSGNLLFEIADHLPNFAIVTEPEKMSKPRSKSRTYSEANIAKFRHKLSLVNWAEITEENSAETCYSRFLQKYQSIFNECFPLVTVSRKKMKDKKWLTKGLAISIRHKTRLYKRYIHKPSESNKSKYKVYKNKLSKVIRQCEKEYYQRLLHSCKASVKHLWQVYGKLLDKAKGKQPNIVSKLVEGGKQLTDCNDIANCFNNYFSSIGLKLAQQHPSNTNYKKYLTDPVQHNMFLSPVIEHEVRQELTRLVPNKAPGYDGVPPKIISSSADLITEPLTHIFNQSFLDGEVPKQLKIAKVIPIHKKMKQCDPGNYRPISLLSIFDKILERLVCKRLYSFLNKYNILYDYQFGFREKHSTILALIEIMDSIRENLDKGNSIIGIYLDLSKAFDTVNHKILLHKLEYYGIRGNALAWFASYLSDRQQLTFVNNMYSSTKPVTVGVPQGSVLGPLLFLLYVNDIHNCVNEHTVRLFADDTNLFIVDPNLTVCRAKAEKALIGINEWLTNNQLTLNIEKTCYSVFSKTKKKIQSIKLNNREIERVSCSRYLGMEVDEELSWSEHVNVLCNKLMKLRYVFFSLSRFIDTDMVKQIYYAYVYPVILYGIELYGVAKKYILNQLQVVQNKLLRTLCKLPPRYSATQLHNELNLLKVNKIYELAVLTYVYKQQHGLLPSVFDAYFVTNADLGTRKTRQSNKLYVKRFKTSLGDKCTKTEGARLWNVLPSYLKESRTLNTFRRNCRKYLLTCSK